VQTQRPPGPEGQQRQGRGDTVIVYHAIGSIPRNAREWNGFVRPERFAAHMAYLAERRTVVDLDALFAHDPSPGPPRVAITFDDAYRSVLEHAIPVLREHGFPATLFVPTKWIGTTNVWDPDSDIRRELMTAAELAELARDGFALESHGHGHVDYARAEPRTVEDDVRASVERLTELLGRPPRYLAYPYGRASPAAAEEAKRLGLRGAFALDRPQIVSGCFAMKRIPIFPADTVPIFALKTTGYYFGWRQSAPVRAGYRAVRPLVRNRWLWP
jgi:peptidoglycan/xylan/chitin deacetylase (PgdA/CDA1 family)